MLGSAATRNPVFGYLENIPGPEASRVRVQPARRRPFCFQLLTYASNSDGSDSKELHEILLAFNFSPAPFSVLSIYIVYLLSSFLCSAVLKNE